MSAVLTIKPPVLGRSAILLGQEPIGEIYRCGGKMVRLRMTVRFGAQRRDSAPATSFETAQRIVALHVGEALVRMGLADAEDEVRVIDETEGAHG